MCCEHQHHSLIRVHHVRRHLQVHDVVTALALVKQKLSNLVSLQVIDLVLLWATLKVTAYHFHHEPRNVVRTQDMTTHATTTSRTKHPQRLPIKTGHNHLIFIADGCAAFPDTLSSPKNLTIDRQSRMVGIHRGSWNVMKLADWAHRFNDRKRRVRWLVDFEISLTSTVIFAWLLASPTQMNLVEIGWKGISPLWDWRRSDVGVYIDILLCKATLMRLHHLRHNTKSIISIHSWLPLHLLMIEFDPSLHLETEESFLIITHHYYTLHLPFLWLPCLIIIQELHCQNNSSVLVIYFSTTTYYLSLFKLIITIFECRSGKETCQEWDHPDAPPSVKYSSLNLGTNALPKATEKTHSRHIGFNQFSITLLWGSKIKRGKRKKEVWSWERKRKAKAITWVKDTGSYGQTERSRTGKR